MHKLLSIGILAAATLSALPAAAAGIPDPRTAFIRSCETQMVMSQAACSCLADKAEAELDAKAIAYLSLPANDVEHSTAMAKSMSGGEMSKIDKFMKTAPDQCHGAK